MKPVMLLNPPVLLSVLVLTCRLMLAALVVLVLIAVTNFGAMFYCCYATDYYGLWLQTFHRKDLYCLRILVCLRVVLSPCWISHFQAIF